MKGNINGRPTKEFFVHMITRYNTIRDAILDLLDNSVDGASKIQPDDFSGLFIKLNISEDEFVLEDNCGGFSLEIAQKYAFRFGRPSDTVTLGKTIGRFGVGMKRALFKMGAKFEVESKSEKDHFQVDVNVEDWKTKTEEITNNEDIKEIVEDWSFDYKLIEKEDKNLQTKGTFIKVHELLSDVKEEFKDDSFLHALEKDIENLLNFSLEKGLEIELNGKKLERKEIEIFNETTHPYIHEFEKDDVNYRIVAGLGETGQPSLAGWYIYCNNRLVLEANTDSITGWGVGSIPRFTNDYAMFRGIIFLDSDETIKLPLTTTKKGVDSSSEVYKRALTVMNEATLKVITFLKDVKKLDNPNEYRTLLGEGETKRLNVIDLKKIEIESDKVFTIPEIDYEEVAKKPEYVRIAFSEKRAFAEKVKQYNGAKNFSELGSSIFSYYVEMEEIENE